MGESLFCPEREEQEQDDVTADCSRNTPSQITRNIHKGLRREFYQLNVYNLMQGLKLRKQKANCNIVSLALTSGLHKYNFHRN